MNRLSDHVSYKEAIRSNTAKRRGITNIPTDSQLGNMVELATSIFEPVRNHFKVPIFISSMFRSGNLNRAIKGAKGSQHMANKGAAMDLDADMFGKVTNEDIFTYIKDNLDYDQLIMEGLEDGLVSWVHVSYKTKGNRNRTLIMYREDGKSKYLPYTVDNYERFIK